MEQRYDRRHENVKRRSRRGQKDLDVATWSASALDTALCIARKQHPVGLATERRDSIGNTSLRCSSSGKYLCLVSPSFRSKGDWFSRRRASCAEQRSRECQREYIPKSLLDEAREKEFEADKLFRDTFWHFHVIHKVLKSELRRLFQHGCL